MSFINFSRYISRLYDEKQFIYKLHFSNAQNQRSSNNSSIVWMFIVPIVPLLFYIILAQINIFPAVDGIDRLLYVSLGVVGWFLFSGLVTAPVSVIRGVMTEIEQSKFLMLTSILVKIFELFIDSLIRFIVVVAIIISFFSDVIEFSIFALPLLAFWIFIFFGLGLLASLIGMAFSNFSKFWLVFMNYGIFISGVLFPIAKIEAAGFIAKYNPFYIAIDSIRSLVVLGSYEFSASYIVMSFILICFSVFGLITFIRFEHIVRESL